MTQSLVSPKLNLVSSYEQQFAKDDVWWPVARQIFELDIQFIDL
jgi:hypothetical protein